MAKSTAPKAPSKSSGCVLLTCSCRHDYQDLRYQGRRVFNLMPGSKARCTVCQSVRSA